MVRAELRQRDERLLDRPRMSEFIQNSVFLISGPGYSKPSDLGCRVGDYFKPIVSNFLRCITGAPAPVSFSSCQSAELPIPHREEIKMTYLPPSLEKGLGGVLSRMTQPWMRLRMCPRALAARRRAVLDFTYIVSQMRQPEYSGKVLLRFRYRGEELMIRAVVSESWRFSEFEFALERMARHFMIAARRPTKSSNAADALRSLCGTPEEAPSLGQADAPNAGVQDVEVFRQEVAVNAISIVSRGRDSDTTTRQGQILRSLKRSGMTRPLVLPSLDWSEQLTALERSMPNFSAVTRSVVRPHLALLLRGVRHRMAPVLLLGSPGVGKTHFARAIANLMGFAQALFVSVSAETNGSALGGSSAFWSNSSPGQLFEALAWGSSVGTPAANPVVVLDEIDKSAGDQRNDPLGALYTLLEQDTARTFQDQSVPDLHIDASHVRFLATANDARAIPAALRSRLVIFEIPSPTRDQLRGVAQGIYESLIDKYKLPLARRLHAAVIEQALELPPREIKIALDCAIANAAARDSAVLELADWAAAAPSGRGDARKRIGF